jgi:hypothetical protein
MPDLPIGTRVRVIRDPDFGPGPWPDQPSGTVTTEPETVETTSGPMLIYWVTFDEPQFDADGEGPYPSSQVLRRNLEVVGG